MRNVLVVIGLVVAAFAVGSTGAPGRIAAAAAGWLSDNGTVELRGPVGDAIRQAL
ncbi:MAG: hypothetical protein ABMB14_13215 [Myxococcota bacterium]